jgi:hypothetical protein
MDFPALFCWPGREGPGSTIEQEDVKEVSNRGGGGAGMGLVSRLRPPPTRKMELANP